MEERSYTTQRLDHLGIVAGICLKINLIQLIDKAVGPQDREVSVGEAVQAMILNALGFSSRAMYLTPEFFQNKPLDRLIRPGLRAHQLNDDCLGRALDILFKTGITELFATIAAHALTVFGIDHRFRHLDSTSFSFYGDYPTEEPHSQKDEPQSKDGSIAEHADNAPQPIHITHGYSKDKRPDLKQAMLSLLCTHRSAIPTWIEVLDGNTSDKTQFPKTIQSFCQQLEGEEPPFFVADSALYSQANITKLSEYKWLTRVPESIKEVKNLYQTVDVQEWCHAGDKNYLYTELGSTWGGINQRWILIRSEPLFRCHSATLERRRTREQSKAEKQWKKLTKASFQCESNARAAALSQIAKWPLHQANFQVEKVEKYSRRGRPPAGAMPDLISWKLSGTIDENPTAIEKATRKLGKFIVATNELDDSVLKTSEMLSVYKEQNVSGERGFRFLKDPLFFASAMYLQKPSRIMALIMVMCLSLLIYALAENSLREALNETMDAIPDQRGEPTWRPTMRRVFQIFEGIDVLRIYTTGKMEETILNISHLHKKIARLLGPEIEKIYGLDRGCGR